MGAAAAIILALMGTAVAAYSYTHLEQRDALFNQKSMQLDGQSYRTWQANLEAPGNYFIIFSPKIVGSVTSNGTNVEFYLVNDTNWDLWMTDMGQRSTLSVVDLYPAQGQFSFIPPNFDSYIVVLVNHEYPNVNNVSVDVDITFHYVSLFSFCAFIAGLVMLGIAIVILTAMTRRSSTLVMSLLSNGKSRFAQSIPSYQVWGTCLTKYCLH